MRGPEVPSTRVQSDGCCALASCGCADMSKSNSGEAVARPDGRTTDVPALWFEKAPVDEGPTGADCATVPGPAAHSARLIALAMVVWIPGHSRLSTIHCPTRGWPGTARMISLAGRSSRLPLVTRSVRLFDAAQVAELPSGSASSCGLDKRDVRRIEDRSISDLLQCDFLGRVVAPFVGIVLATAVVAPPDPFTAACPPVSFP
jgi:hypothetical protein